MGFFDWFKNSDDFERGTLHEMMPQYQFKLPELRTVKGNLTKNIEGKWAGTSFQDNYYYNEKTHLPYNSSIDYITKFRQISGQDYGYDTIELIRQTPFFDNKLFKFRREIVTKKRTIEITEKGEGIYEFFKVDIVKEILIKTYFWYFEKRHDKFVRMNLFCEPKEIQNQTNKLVLGMEEASEDFFLTKEGDFYILKEGYELELEGYMKPAPPDYEPYDSEGNIRLKTTKNKTEGSVQQLSNDKLLFHSCRDIDFIMDSGGIISEHVKNVIPMNTTELFRVREKESTRIEIKGDYVDDRDTIIQDSVINKSNIGANIKSKAEEIKEIKELLDSGAIDKDDYEKMKREIIG
jgi:hypothetical protein